MTNSKKNPSNISVQGLTDLHQKSILTHYTPLKMYQKKIAKKIMQKVLKSR